MSNSVWPHRRQTTRLPHPWDSPGKNTGVGCHFLLQCMKVKSQSEVAQSCLTLSYPMDCSLPGFSVHEIFQARVLEWGAIAFSKCHILDSMYKWYHMIFVFLFLTSLSVTISNSILVAAHGIISFFLWLSNISLYVLYHIFTHSSVDGHLGYFPVLGIVNSAAMRIWVHVSFLKINFYWSIVALQCCVNFCCIAK